MTKELAFYFLGDRVRSSRLGDDGGRANLYFCKGFVDSKMGRFDKAFAD